MQVSAAIKRAQVRTAGHASKLKNENLGKPLPGREDGKGVGFQRFKYVCMYQEKNEAIPRRDNAVLIIDNGWSIPRGMFYSFSTPYVLTRHNYYRDRNRAGLGMYSNLFHETADSRNWRIYPCT